MSTCESMLATSTSSKKMFLHGSSPCQCALLSMLVCKSLARFVIVVHPIALSPKKEHSTCIIEMLNGLDSMCEFTGQLRRCDFFQPAMRDYMTAQEAPAIAIVSLRIKNGDCPIVMLVYRGYHLS